MAAPVAPTPKTDPTEAASGRATRARGSGNAEIRRRLTAAISEGRLPPGARLPEERLAQSFGTTRARIREVLTVLAREKLVDLQLNRGACVARPTIEETRHICEARMVVERSMTRLAAERIGPAGLTVLRGLVEEERAAWARGDVAVAVARSRRFHLAIAEEAGNPILSEMLSNLLSRTALSLSVYASRGPAGCLVDDHAALLQALAIGDADRAEALMVEHIEHMIGRMNLAPMPTEVDLELALRDIP
jgi:DNA-binding GntR family transcriptional regulator